MGCEIFSVAGWPESVGCCGGLWNRLRRSECCIGAVWEGEGGGGKWLDKKVYARARRTSRRTRGKQI